MATIHHAADVPTDDASGAIDDRPDREDALAAVRTTKAGIALLEGDQKALVEAAWDLARVHVENHDVVSEMPRTCYLLGLVHLRLAGTLSDAKALAKGYFEETRRRFPESREALLAREQLKQM